MSGTALKWAFEIIIPNLKNQAEKLVILRLADRANTYDICWPSHIRTAADLNITTRSVQTAVRNLESLGLLNVKRRAGFPGVIHLKLDSVVPAELALDGKKKPKKSKKTLVSARGETISLLCDAGWGETISLRGRSHCTSGGETISPKPTIESISKPPQGDVVVADQMVWPKALSAEQIAACTAALVPLPPPRWQNFVDELAGALATRPIKAPASWLRAVVKRVIHEGALLEFSADVRHAREARAAALHRAGLADPLTSRHLEPEQFIQSRIGKTYATASRALVKSIRAER